MLCKAKISNSFFVCHILKQGADAIISRYPLIFGKILQKMVPSLRLTLLLNIVKIGLLRGTTFSMLIVSRRRKKISTISNKTRQNLLYVLKKGQIRQYKGMKTQHLGLDFSCLLAIQQCWRNHLVMWKKKSLRQNVKRQIYKIAFLKLNDVCVQVSFLYIFAYLHAAWGEKVEKREESLFAHDAE